MPYPRLTTFACAATLLAGAAAPAHAQGRPPVLATRDAAVAGVFTAATLGASRFDRALADRLQRPDVQERRVLAATAASFRNLAQPGFTVGFPLLWAAGRLADDRTTAAVGLRGAEAVTVAAVAIAGVKLVAGRARPSVPGRDPTSWRFGRGLTRGSEYRSFPSGHTATAFAAATAATAELAARRSSLRWTAGVPLYVSAGAVGWARMYENRHWASDVVGGAAVGTLAGAVVSRWHRRHPDNAFDRRLLGRRATGVTLGVGLALGPGGAAPALVALPAR